MSLGIIDIRGETGEWPEPAAPVSQKLLSRRKWSPLACVATLAAIVTFGIGVLLATANEVSASPTNPDGSPNCQACHANPDFGSLRMADGTKLAIKDSAPLCAQCHQPRYDAWISGTHGFPGFKEGSPPGDTSTRTSCTTCHSPHEPRIALKDVTRPHPEPVAAPPSLPTDLIMILGISLAFVAGGFVLTLIGRGKS